MPSARTKALALAFFTAAYNLVEGAVAMTGAATSGSNALLGFGLDSFVESLSGLVMVWRFWSFDVDADHEDFERVERQAARLVAGSFFVLGGYVVVDAGYALFSHAAPEVSRIGIGLAIVSMVVMPVLFVLKYRLGKAIGSPSLIADSKETLACVLLSAALLLGLGAFYIWRLWWIDSAAALVIAVLIIREGFETMEECDCESGRSTVNPIRFSCEATLPLMPEAVAEQILDLNNWPAFDGFGPLPGIRRAEFENRTDGIVGTRIRVTNRDGSSHVEEIVIWEPRRLQLHMHDFTPPVSRLATAFDETWTLQAVGDATKVVRSFELHPTSRLTKPLLWLISKFLKRAIARHLEQMTRAQRTIQSES